MDSHPHHLCIGLDPDPKRLPAGFSPDAAGIQAFCLAIIEATQDLAAAWKVNTAFFEAWGSPGWQALEAVRAALPAGSLAIADAKRGDIGNTSRHYARCFFEHMAFDALTVAPYMGHDSVEPFLEHAGKTVFLLGLTSNPGAQDYQYRNTEGEPLWQGVLRTSQRYKGLGTLGYVVGATRAEHLQTVRALAPEAPLLIPGVGAQGGDLQAVVQATQGGGPVYINASRSILYASNGPDFAQAARSAAQAMQAAIMAASS